MINAATLFAIELASNEIPASSTATFQAGYYVGMGGTKDTIRAQVEACFVADQKLADDTDAVVKTLSKDIAAHDWADLKNIESLYFGDKPLIIAAVGPCLSDPQYADVKEAYMTQIAIEKRAEADKHPKPKLIKAVLAHKGAIIDSAISASKNWNLGTDDGFFQAGVEIGKINAIIYSPWMTADDEFLQ